MKIFLKIKIKSLIAEQALILREERRIGDYDNPVRKQMRKHREIEIAEEIRLSLLAYGFLRGRRYRQLERTTHRPLTKDQVQRLAKMVARFGGGYGSSLDNMLGSWLGEPEDRAEIDRLRAEALARKEASRARWRSNKAS